MSTRKGTDICEFAQHGVIRKSICSMKFVYLYIYVYKEVLTVSTRKGTNIHIYIYMSSHNVGSYTKLSMIGCMYSNTCEYLYAKRF